MKAPPTPFKALLVVGTRPNFVKVAALHRAFEQHPAFRPIIVHTGQHYDHNMSGIFFSDFDLPSPDYYLGINGGSSIQQVGRLMVAFEKTLMQIQPDIVVVVGDVNATFATAMTAVHKGFFTVHVEAGLRSFDQNMPEEINRILTDQISDLLFATEKDGVDNLAREGIPKDKIHLVGNVMIDSLVQQSEKIKNRKILQRLGFPPKAYLLATIHRPSNVDSVCGLKNVLDLLKKTAALIPVVFPIHPRSLKQFKNRGLHKDLSDIPNLLIIEPTGYLDFCHLIVNARAVLTDSGGVQEETSFLNIPCLTFRTSTERPVTMTLGTNILIDDLNPETAVSHLKNILKHQYSKETVIPFWDGKASQRIVEVLLKKITD